MGGRNSEMPWRQGSVVPTATAVTLGLFGEEEASTRVALVISHDCDMTVD